MHTHSPTLTYLSRGGDVVRLQLILRELDYRLEPDGFFGPMTREALKTFQALHGLPASGEAYPATWDQLEAALAAACGINEEMQKTSDPMKDRMLSLSAGNRT